MSCNIRRLRAFTLVELLVVIGIIALLISILLPSLTKARESAKNAKCLSNLHQIAIALQIYANDNKDQVPVGCSAGTSTQNQWWAGYWMTDGGYGMWGCLYNAKLMNEPRIYFCPNQNDPRFAYDDPQNNPWPTDATWNSLSMRTRIGYTFRPSVVWTFTSTSATPNTDLVRLSIELNKKAMVSDIVGIPGNTVALTNIHKNHLNVLYSDRSARGVDHAAYDSIQLSLSTQSTSTVATTVRGTYYDYGYLGYNTIWDNFDGYNR
jgi:prepilin-type N-terminal cleavage/methylation domain-containing protein